MARYKTYDYRQRVLLPVFLEDQLMSGTLEFAIHTLVNRRLDISIFDGKYRNDGTGRVYVLEIKNKAQNFGPYAGLNEMSTTSKERPRLIVRVFGEIYLSSGR